MGAEECGDRTTSEVRMKSQGPGEKLWEEMVGNRLIGGFWGLKQLDRVKNRFWIGLIGWARTWLKLGTGFGKNNWHWLGERGKVWQSSEQGSEFALGDCALSELIWKPRSINLCSLILNTLDAVEVSINSRATGAKFFTGLQTLSAMSCPYHPSFCLAQLPNFSTVSPASFQAFFLFSWTMTIVLRLI